MPPRSSRPRSTFLLFACGVCLAACLACAGGGRESASPDSSGAATRHETLRGEIRYFADAMRFVDCSSGLSIPVTGPARADLERAYLEAAFWPGASVLAELRGHIEDRPAMEGEGTEPSLVVTGVARVDAHAWCRLGSSRDATGSYRVALAAASSPGREIQLRLDADGIATMLTDFRNDRPPIVERGTWQPQDETHVRLRRVTLDGRPAAGDRIFLVHEDGDLLYQGEEFGSRGLALQRQAPGAEASSITPPPLPSELDNAVYSGILESPVRLSEGRYEGAPFVPQGASRPTVERIDGLYATGDLDGDGRPDAAVVLVSTAGGSGTFFHLAAMTIRGGDVVNEGTALVGDRVQVHAVRIDDGRVELDLVEHGPEDPLCCPTQPALREWALRAGRLEPAQPPRRR